MNSRFRMLGRAAYDNPYMLSEVDTRFFGAEAEPINRRQVVEQMLPYIEAFLAKGGKVHNVTRHMLGLFHGQPGARKWRQHLTVEAGRAGAGPEILTEALARLPEAAFTTAA